MKKLITPNEKLKELDNSFLKGEITIHQFRIKMMEHFTFLDQPLAKEMFVGDKAIFVGFEVIENPNTISEIEYFSNKCVVKFLRSYVLNGEKINKVLAYSIKTNNWEAGEEKLIKTLHDLAELTKSNQLELK